MAADPSRVAALNDRRNAAVSKLNINHSTTIDEKRQRENELRLRRLQQLEKKMVGTGRRLGSQESTA